MILAKITITCPVLGLVSFEPDQYEVGVRMEGEWPYRYPLIHATAVCSCGAKHEIRFGREEGP